MRTRMLSTFAALATAAPAAWSQAPPAVLPPAFPAYGAPVAAAAVVPAGGVPGPSGGVVPAGGATPPSGGIQQVHGFAPLPPYAPPAPTMDGPPPMYPPPGVGRPPIPGLEPMPEMFDGPPGLPGAFGEGGHKTTPCECLFMSAEYLMWWTSRGPSSTPLITIGSPNSQGILGQGTTTVVYGQNDFDFGMSSGVRATAGGWFGPARRHGFMLSGFLMEQRGEAFNLQSGPDGLPVIARPYTDANTGQNAAILVSSSSSQVINNADFSPNTPIVFNTREPGEVDSLATSQVWGAEFNFLLNIYRGAPSCDKYCNWTMLYGFRYLDIEEGLQITSRTEAEARQRFVTPNPTSGVGPIQGTTQTLQPVPISFAGLRVYGPATLTTMDSFDTKNTFYGGQLGTQFSLNYGRCFVDMTGKCAVGVMHQILRINGESTIRGGTDSFGRPNPLGRANGGVLAVGPAIGKFHNDEFAVVPEGTINFGYQFTQHLRGFVGYNVIYASNVIRPGDQIDPVINTTYIPASATYGTAFGVVAPPAPRFVQSDFWIQGINFGLGLVY